MDSENGKPWCALSINNQGVVPHGQWHDCEEGCPGTEFQCAQQDLFNYDGVCVSDQDKKDFEEKYKGDF